MMSGIPLKKVTQLENEKLISLEPDLKSKVIGQNHAIEKIAKAIRRNRMGLKDPNKPIGSFIFIGPTGVGKCVTGESVIKIRNKSTGEISEMSFLDFKKLIKE
jgi:ATP-dependent Clp protease ATP-binding subunit ClpC